jgi:phage-related protein
LTNITPEVIFTYSLEYFTRYNGEQPVADWLDNCLDDKQRPVIMAKIDCFEREGMKLINTNMLKRIQGEHDLYEIRGGKCRVVVFHDRVKEKFVMLYGFMKKKPREPGEIDEAKRMLDEYLLNQ